MTGAAPTAGAVQVNGGAWTALTFSGSTATFTVPTATSPYAVAVLCPAASSETDETIYETTAGDTVTPSSPCTTTPTLVTTAANYNISAVGGLNARVYIDGYPGPTTPLAASSENVSAPSGVQDVAVVAYGASANNPPIGIQIQRGVNITGAAVTIPNMAASDATSTASVVVNGTPSGFTFGNSIEYFTAGGAAIPLTGSAVTPTSYDVVASGDTQAGDEYVIWPSAVNSGVTSLLEAQQSSATAQNTTLTLPGVLNYSGPTAAAYPTFNPSYNGFTISSAKTSWLANLRWSNGANNYLVAVYATSSFLGSNPTSVPNLSSLSGFLVPPASGTSVGWTLTAAAKTVPFYGVVGVPPLNEMAQYSKAFGGYTEP